MTLIAAVMLMTFAAIAAAGLSFMVANAVQWSVVSSDAMQAKYLAEAGLHEAAYTYRQRDQSGVGSFTLKTVAVESNKEFTIYADDDAAVMMVDTRNCFLFPLFWFRTYLIGAGFQKVVDNRHPVIDRLTIVWNRPNRLQRIRIDNRTVFSGSVTSPASIDIPDLSLSGAPKWIPINYLEFEGNMPSADVQMTFHMSDGSTLNFELIPAGTALTWTASVTGRIPSSDVSEDLRGTYDVINGTYIDLE